MRIGHIIALVGALLVAAGCALFDWQTFMLADVTAKGFEVAPAGQATLLIAGLVVLASALGLVTRKRYQMAGVTLVAAVFGLGWLVFANMGRMDAFELMAYEEIELQAGYTVAVVGMFLAFFGPLVVFASEPVWDPKSQFLRVALLWKDTVIQEKVLLEAQTFNIGEDLRNDFIIPEEQLPKKFPLFRADRKGDYQIGLTRELDGQITVNQQTDSIGDYVKNATENVSGVNFVPIGLGDWGMVQLSQDLRIFFQFVQPEAGREARKGLVAFEEEITSSIAVSFFAQAAFVVLAVLLLDIEMNVDYTPQDRMDPDVQAQVIQPDEPPEIEEEDEEDEEEVAKKAGGEEGEFGDPDEFEESVVPELEAEMVDEIDPKKVGLNDLLSTDKLGGEGAISEILNQTNEGMSNKLAVAMGGEGSTLVVGAGAGGMGFTGAGSGGGGSGVGRIQGMGDIDTGSGRGVRAGLGKKGQRKVGKVDIGAGATQGFCNKSHVASVVRRRAAAVRSCYEQRLQVKKDLQGKLTARWTIEMDGKVGNVTAEANTIGDSATTNCIFRALRRMRFQKPEGGVCIIRWPFVFSPG